MLTQVTLPSLRLNSQGVAVSLLQRLLVIYGYEKYLGTKPVDGNFGAKTEEAIKAFQGDHFLNKDGVVGSLTWKAMAFPFDDPNKI